MLAEKSKASSILEPFGSEDPSRDFIEENKMRVGLISAGAKVYQKLQPHEMRSTLTRMIFDSRPDPGKEELIHQLKEKMLSLS